MKEGYRELTVSKVRRGNDQMDVSFKDCVVGSIIPYAWLQEHGVNPENIVEGIKVHLKGKAGNEDLQLFGIGNLEDLQLVSN